MVNLLKVACPDFANGETIPDRFTCNGENINPELHLEGIPEETKSLAIIIDDPDGNNWVHWLVFNIPKTNIIAENSVPGEEGMNDFKKTSYQGPCPPPGKPHRYFFRVFALDARLNLDFVTRDDLELEMKPHILAKGELMGKFGR